MKLNQVKKGMQVLIDKHCRATSSSCTVVPEMRKYLNTVQTIQRDGKFGEHIRIQGWNWNCKDLTPAMTEMAPMHEKHIPANIDPFNPSELDL